MKVALGGTFEVLHIGHMYLLTIAMELADELYIGITTNRFAEKYKCYTLSDYETRLEKVKEFIESQGWKGSLRFFPLNEPYGPTIKIEDIDILVVTPETYPMAIKINSIRVDKGMKPLKIFVTDYISNESGYPVNSTFIKLGVIDYWGRPIT
jgi:pantetheine-phosphate adenylyltransferase